MMIKKQAFFVSARREELRALVESSSSVHDHHFLCQTKPAHLGGGGEGLRPGEDLPPNGVVHPLVLQLPHVSGQGGLGPLAGVLEFGLVVAVASLPLWHGEADVGLLLLADHLHLRLVDRVGIQASGSLHGAVFCPSAAVAVGVERPLHWQIILEHLLVVPSDDAPKVGHRAVGELNCVSVEHLVKWVAGWEGGVEYGEEPLADLGLHTHAVGWVKPD